MVYIRLVLDCLISSHPYCLWLVVAICIGGRSGIRCFLRIDRSESGLLEFDIQCRNILLPDFRPARDEFLESFFEVFEYGSGLRRGCGIGAVRNSQDAAEMLGQNGEILRLFCSGGGSVEIA